MKFNNLTKEFHTTGIQDVGQFEQEVAYLWDTQGAEKAIELVLVKENDGYREYAYRHDLGFLDDVNEELKIELKEEADNMDIYGVTSTTLNNIQAIHDKLKEFQQEPKDMLFEIGGGAEQARPFDKDEFIEFVDDMITSGEVLD